jgi:hypothetical protein
MRGKRAINLLFTLLFLLVEVAASAKEISVKFASDLPGQGTYRTILPNEVAGVVPVNNWNNVVSGAPDAIATYTNLTVNNNGTPSGSGVNLTIHFDDLSPNAYGTVVNEGYPINTPNRKLMDSYADVLGPLSSNMTNGTYLTITNLSGLGPFDLYFISSGALGPPFDDRVARYTFYDGTDDSAPLIVTRYGRNPQNSYNLPNEHFVEMIDDGTPQGTTAGNYYVVHNLNPSSGSLYIAATALHPLGRPARGAINGLQFVSINPAGPTGDYNGNGVVDAADYVVWRKTSGQGATPPGSGADGNGNGTIDPGDYTFWRSKFGNLVPGIGSGSNLAVPEASSLSLLIVSAVVVLCTGNGRKNRIGS